MTSEQKCPYCGNEHSSAESVMTCEGCASKLGLVPSAADYAHMDACPKCGAARGGLTECLACGWMPPVSVYYMNSTGKVRLAPSAPQPEQPAPSEVVEAGDDALVFPRRTGGPVFSAEIVSRTTRPPLVISDAPSEVETLRGLLREALGKPIAHDPGCGSNDFISEMICDCGLTDWQRRVRQELGEE